jgi:hypothetical protein
MTNITYGADHGIYESTNFICPVCGHKWIGYRVPPEYSISMCNGVVAGNDLHKLKELKEFEDD